MNNIKTVLTLIVIFMLAACSDDGPIQEPLPKARVKPLAELLIDYEYSAAAQALSLRDSDIPAELSTNVESIPVTVGDTVEKDSALIQLDCHDTLAARNQAKAALDAMKAREALAKQQYRRAKSLRASRSISEDELNLEESAMNAATAERVAQISALDIAQRNVERCTVTAPFNGVVTHRYIQEGERVNPGMPLLHLVDHENLEVQAQITADDADSLSKAIAPLFSAGRQQYRVAVKTIAAVIDPRTRTQAVRLEFVETKPKAGTLGKLVWKDVRQALPTNLISQRNQARGVLITNDSHVKFHPLPDAIPGQPAFVELPPDTLIITDGRFSLSHGDEIEIIE